MQIKDVMTKAPQCIDAQASIRQAATRMKELDVGALPVCADDRIVGFVTDRDIALRAVADGRDADTTTAREVMTPSVIFCFEDEPVESATEKMEQRQVRRIPVLNRDKRLVGIVTLGDIATRVRDDRLAGEVLERISEPVANA